jgi:hypothetical protein
MYWLLRRKSKFSTRNTLLIYKAILKPTLTYGIQLWGTASTSNIEILALCALVRAEYGYPKGSPNTNS